MLADIGQLGYVDTRGGHQRQDFPRARLDGDDGADFVLHQLLAVLLELRIDGGDNVVAGDGFLVEFAVFERLLDLVVGVAEENVIALFPAEVLLPGRLDAGHARIVARTVFARVAVDVVLVHLGHIPQQVAARIDGVVTDAAHLSLEARETVLDFGEFVIGLGRDLLEHRHALETDPRAVPLVLLHFSADELRGDVQYGGEGEGVELAHLPRTYEDVVGYFVAHQDFPVPVIDDAPGGIDDFPDRRVVVRIDLVVLVEDLDGEDLRQEDGRGHSQSDEEPDVSVVGGHLRESGARMSMISRETTHPAARDAAKRRTLKEKGREPAPSAQI